MSTEKMSTQCQTNIGFYLKLFIRLTVIVFFYAVEIRDFLCDNTSKNTILPYNFELFHAKGESSCTM